MGSRRGVAVSSTKNSSSSSSSRPLPHECVAVCDALALLHGRPSLKRDQPRTGCEIQEPHTVLDSLVRTILSQNTTDTTSQRAFSQLKAAFPDWDQVRTAAPGTVEAAIKVGGLADIKAARIKAILNSLLEQHGSLSLEHLRQLPADDIKAQLSSYKGVGPKTIACVLMFCLGRAEFPVDTHVWEISKQLGWVAAAASREQTYEHLNACVPDDIKYDLHVLMVQHGKVCAACGKRGSGQKRKAPDVPCPLAPFKRGKGCSSSTSESAAGSKDHSKASSSRGASKKQTVVEAAAAGVAAAAVAAAAAVEVKLEEGAAAAVGRRRSCRSKLRNAFKEEIHGKEEKPCPLAVIAATAAAAAAAAAGVRIKPEPEEAAAAAAAVVVKQEVDV